MKQSMQSCRRISRFSEFRNSEVTLVEPEKVDSIQVEDVHKIWSTGEHAVKGVTMHLYRGQVVFPVFQ